MRAINFRSRSGFPGARCFHGDWRYGRSGLQSMRLPGLVWLVFLVAVPFTAGFPSAAPPGGVDQTFVHDQARNLSVPRSMTGDGVSFASDSEESLMRHGRPPVCRSSMSATATVRSAVNICNRTEDVRDAILRLIPNQNDCRQVTSGELAGITGILELGYDGISSLKPGDFDGLTSLEALNLGDNSIRMLPAGIFDALISLKVLYLWGNSLETLPDGIFSPLTSLTWLYLEQNKLSALPDGIFDGLGSLTVLDLNENEFSTLPGGIFDGLTALESLDLSRNKLVTLPGGIFDGLTSLEVLSLEGNSLGALPDDIFDGLTSLERLDAGENLLSALSGSLFDQLGTLESLDLHGNVLAMLSDEVFSGLVSLKRLDLSRNALRLLSGDVFEELVSLEVLGLRENSLSVLPAGIFDTLSRLNVLNLADNALHTLPEGIFEGLTNLPVSTFESEGEYHDYPGLVLSSNPGAPFQPVVDAGVDQSAGPGTAVSLQGRVTGPWGRNSRWKWIQVQASGSSTPVMVSQSIRLTANDTAVPGFTAPMMAGEYYFRAVSIPSGLGVPVEDWGHGNSAPDWVTVRVDPSTSTVDTPMVVEFALIGNYPNPFNPSTRILLDLPESAAISIGVFNMLGQRVYRADSVIMEAGPSRSLMLEAGPLPAGVYVYRVTAQMGSESRIATGRMTLLK